MGSERPDWRGRYSRVLSSLRCRQRGDSSRLGHGSASARLPDNTAALILATVESMATVNTT